MNGGLISASFGTGCRLTSMSTIMDIDTVNSRRLRKEKQIIYRLLWAEMKITCV